MYTPSGSAYLFAKAMHVIGFVSWFSGLLYLVRLFIYHVESAQKPEPERSVLHAQFVVMERRLWRAITVPAMVLTVVFGSYLAAVYIGANRRQLQVASWLFVKFGFVGALLVYHLFCGTIRNELADGQCRWTSARLRQWNELATLLLVTIVMLAVFKSTFNAVWGTVALVGFGVLLAAAVKLLRRRASGST
jgi:protoporphyrinogen IX oxidase